jgi:5'-nucleotidase / UDP-sugar diphosphatase
LTYKTPFRILNSSKSNVLSIQSVYRVALPDFLAAGGDGYAMLKDKPNIQTGLPLRELIVDTIRRRGVIAAQEEGRILRLE